METISNFVNTKKLDRSIFARLLHIKSKVTTTPSPSPSPSPSKTFPSPYEEKISMIDWAGVVVETFTRGAW